MKLYTNPRSRGQRVVWTLEELGVPCEIVNLNMEKGEHKTPEYLKIHPLGQVPALEDDGQVIIESGAICVYLAAKYPEKRLGPEDQSADYYQWCFYCFGSLEPALIDTMLHTQWLPEEKRSAAVLERAQEALKKVLTHLSAHMENRQWLLGDRFSVADILTGGTLQWGNMLMPLNDYPVLERYIERLSQRPAYLRTRPPVAAQ